MKSFFCRLCCFVACLMIASLELPKANADTLPTNNNTFSTAVFDHTNDQHSYGETVALLNRGVQPSAIQTDTGDNTITLKRGKSVFAVLCRTTGGEFNFTRWKPSCVVAGPSDCYTVYFNSEQEAKAAAEDLRKIHEIRYAELDSTVEACAEYEPSFQSWAAADMNYGHYLSYSSACLSGISTVAIIDSGCFLHPAYASRVTESGYDYVDADNDATNDPFGHGTNVAGILSDCTQGLPVYLYPIRVLDANGSGNASNVMNAVREAAQKGVDVINLSIAGKGQSKALDEAVMDAVDAGITVVIAAGNYATDTSEIYPAHLDLEGALVVGSAESDGRLAAYSDYGESVDLYTYGRDISCCSNDGGYTKATGTSMSTPHIAAAAAVLNLTHNGIRPEEIEARIIQSTDSTLEINIPNLERIIPKQPGFYLSELRMDLRDRVQLPVEMRPLSAMEALHFSSSDESILSVQNGVLIPLRTGTVVVTANCLGLPAYRFTVTVDESDCETIVLPQKMRTIQDEAFFQSGISHAVLPAGLEELGENAFGLCHHLKTIEIPDTVVTIGDNDFSSAAVFCRENSLIYEYVLSHKLQYILKENEIV